MKAITSRSSMVKTIAHRSAKTGVNYRHHGQFPMAGNALQRRIGMWRNRL